MQSYYCNQERTESFHCWCKHTLKHIWRTQIPGRENHEGIRRRIALAGELKQSRNRILEKIQVRLPDLVFPTDSPEFKETVFAAHASPRDYPDVFQEPLDKSMSLGAANVGRVTECTPQTSIVASVFARNRITCGSKLTLLVYRHLR